MNKAVQQGQLCSFKGNPVNKSNNHNHPPKLLNLNI